MKKVLELGLSMDGLPRELHEKAVEGLCYRRGREAWDGLDADEWPDCLSEAGNVFLLIGRRAQCLGWVDYQNHEIRERKKNTAHRGGKAPSVGYLMPEDITRSMLDKLGKSLGSKVLYNQKIGTTSADRRLLILKPSVEVENAAVITAHSRNS